MQQNDSNRTGHRQQKNNIQLKLQAAMKGTSHPGSPPTVASERQGTVSNMHLKEENIEGIYQNHLYVPKLPAASWWRYDYKWILACRYLQESTLIKDMKFGAD